MSQRIPITVLSGYLGAGKTTILNRVLSQAQDRRLAVLVNDFGPVNIDASLIRNATGKVVELSNGCVCCSIGDNLGETLSTIADWSDPPEHVLLEASGVAEPARIAMTVGHWPGFELDAVIVAADVETVRRRAADKFVGALVRSQLRRADIVALTKTDLVGSDTSEAVREWLETLIPGGHVVRADFGQLALPLLLGSAPRRQGATEKTVAGSHAHFTTRLWNPGCPVDLGLLRSVLGTLPADIHRAKGVLIDGATGGRVLVQSVGARATITPVSEPGDRGLVLIASGSGAGLATTLKQLENCIAPAGAANVVPARTSQR